MATILVVDINRTVLATITRQLEFLEYNVLVATDEQEALAVYLRERPIDLVVIDVVLSDDVSGHKLADSLLERDPAQKVLMMSGYPPEVQAKYRTNLRSYPMVQKPLRINEVKRLIRDLIEG